MNAKPGEELCGSYLLRQFAVDPKLAYGSASAGLKNGYYKGVCVNLGQGFLGREARRSL